MQILPLRTAEAILFFFVNESAAQVFAVSGTAAPEWNEGPPTLLLQRTDDCRRTVTTVRRYFVNREFVAVFDSLQLVEIRLVVVSCSGGNMRV